MGMASVNQTRPHSVNQMGKTHSKPLAALLGRGAAWERHAMCESLLKRPLDFFFFAFIDLAKYVKVEFTFSNNVIEKIKLNEENIGSVIME